GWIPRSSHCPFDCPIQHEAESNVPLLSESQSTWSITEQKLQAALKVIRTSLESLFRPVAKHHGCSSVAFCSCCVLWSRRANRSRACFSIKHRVPMRLAGSSLTLSRFSIVLTDRPSMAAASRFDTRSCSPIYLFPFAKWFRVRAQCGTLAL